VEAEQDGLGPVDPRLAPLLDPVDAVRGGRADELIADALEAKPVVVLSPG
jgi:hypothetical protein